MNDHKTIRDGTMAHEGAALVDSISHKHSSQRAAGDLKSGKSVLAPFKPVTSAQDRASGAYEWIEGDRLLVLVMHDLNAFSRALDILQGAIAESLGQSPKRRLTGIVVLPKGMSMNPRSMTARMRALASSRIMVRTSPLEDTRAGAKTIKQEVLDQYAIAAKHAAGQRSDKSPGW